MNPDTEKLRKKYMDHPPEGMTSRDLRRISKDNLLDMDCFLNEDDLFDLSPKIEISYKAKKDPLLSKRVLILFS